MKIIEALNFGSQELHLSTTPRLDAEILLASVLQITRSKLLTEGRSEIAYEAIQKFHELIEKRKEGMPIAYILGSKEFWGLDFKVTPAVLVPRPETEHLVERVLQIIKEENLSKVKILELGTGSGCIPISLASELQKLSIKFEILAVDTSTDALAVAKENYHKLIPDLPVKFIQSNWFSNVPEQKFNLIVSNPPYVNQDLPDLSVELNYEPASALYAEDFGLSDIFEIIKNAPRFLMDLGTLLIEIGSEQKQLLENHLQSNYPQAKLSFIQDLAEKDRIIEIQFR